MRKDFRVIGEALEAAKLQEWEPKLKQIAKFKLGKNLEGEKAETSTGDHSADNPSPSSQQDLDHTLGRRLKRYKIDVSKIIHKDIKLSMDHPLDMSTWNADVLKKLAEAPFFLDIYGFSVKEVKHKILQGWHERTAEEGESTELDGRDIQNVLNWLRKKAEPNARMEEPKDVATTEGGTTAAETGRGMHDVEMRDL